MATCKEIYDEAAPLAFLEDEFVVYCPKRGKTGDKFHSISNRNAVHIKHLITFDMGPLLPLHGLKNLQTLVFAFKEFKNSVPAPKALALGSTLTLNDLPALRIKNKWELPNPPEPILDRCRANNLKIIFVAGLQLLGRYPIHAVSCLMPDQSTYTD